jgi:hypothetical protein
MPNFGDHFVVCRGVRHAPPDLLPNSLILRAAGMDSGLPRFTAVFPMFTVVRRTPAWGSGLFKRQVAVKQGKWTV